MKPIKDMSYVEFISLLKETNRCPGGKATIRWIAQNTFINKDSSVLEIGSNTGFSSLELARLTKCQILGIDPVPEAVQIANEELSVDTELIRQCVKFQVGSAYSIPCDSDSFDLIVAGGSVSFMDNKEIAIKEMERVLKPWGMLSVTNLFYHTPPPQQLLDKVSSVIGTTIHPLTAKDWESAYLRHSNLELYTLETTKLSTRTIDELDEYVAYFLQKPHLAALPSKQREEIQRRWSEILSIFNENHQYLGFIKALLRKRTIHEEPELFRLDT